MTEYKNILRRLANKEGRVTRKPLKQSDQKVSGFIKNDEN